MNQLSTPKISIITITYNCESTLEETIKSVLAQNYPNLEYIIVDGKSTDHTMDIVKRYEQHLSKVISEPDKGISDAFNKGIKMATGDLIGILNADDVMLANALNNIAQHYDGTYDVYRGNIIIWNDQSGLKVKEMPSMKFPMIPINIHVAHQGTFVTPEAYRKWGVFRTDFHYAMDLELLCRFNRNGAKMKQMDVDVALFRIGGQTTTPMVKKKKEYKELIKANGGKQWQANAYYAYLRIIDVEKTILNKCFGEDFKRKLRYRSTKA